MKIPLLLCSLFILLASCGPDFDNRKQHQNKIEHSYEENDPTEDAQAVLDGTADKAELYTLYRDLWQNPLAVIKSMGDLEGKTLADIGAGPYGYFSMLIASRTNVGKVIAIDIDADAVAIMEKAKKLLPDSIQNKIETRQVAPADAQLKDGEVDLILIVNTAIFFEDRVEYFKNLLPGLSKDGKLIVIDFKMRQTPVGPPTDQRIPLGTMESELIQAGYKNLDSNDRSLEFQYIIIASK